MPSQSASGGGERGARESLRERRGLLPFLPSTGREDRRLRQRTRTKVVTGNRAFAPGENDPGEGGEEAEMVSRRFMDL